jgi:hypothetical protein
MICNRAFRHYMLPWFGSHICKTTTSTVCLVVSVVLKENYNFHLELVKLHKLYLVWDYYLDLKISCKTLIWSILFMNLFHFFDRL